MRSQDQPIDESPQQRVLSRLVDYKENGIEVKTLVNKPSGMMKLLSFDHATEMKEHTAPHDVYVLILEGEAELTIEGQPFHLCAGDTITLPGTRPHAVKAKTRFKMLLTRFND